MLIFTTVIMYNIFYKYVYTLNVLKKNNFNCTFISYSFRLSGFSFPVQISPVTRISETEPKQDRINVKHQFGRKYLNIITYF